MAAMVVALMILIPGMSHQIFNGGILLLFKYILVFPLLFFKEVYKIEKFLCHELGGGICKLLAFFLILVESGFVCFKPLVSKNGLQAVF